MSNSRPRLVVAGLVAALLALSSVAVAQTTENRSTRARQAFSRTPRGEVGAGRWVLVYEPTLAEGKAINEVKVARRLGFRVRIASKAEWSAMNEEQFDNFDAIVFGDPSCKSDPRRLDAAVANQEVWSAAVDGNVVVGGFDAVWHANNGTRPGPERLIANSLRFTGLGDETGLNVSLSCYYTGDPAGTAVELLDGIGTFTVNGQGVPPVGGCPDTIAVPDPDHPLVDRLSARQLSGWGCSAHQAFDSVPGSFDTVATLRKSELPVLVAREASI